MPVHPAFQKQHHQTDINPIHNPLDVHPPLVAHHSYFPSEILSLGPVPAYHRPLILMGKLAMMARSSFEDSDTFLEPLKLISHGHRPPSTPMSILHQSRSTIAPRWSLHQSAPTLLSHHGHPRLNLSHLVQSVEPPHSSLSTIILPVPPKSPQRHSAKRSEDLVNPLVPISTWTMMTMMSPLGCCDRA